MNTLPPPLTNSPIGYFGNFQTARTTTNSSNSSSIDSKCWKTMKRISCRNWGPSGGRKDKKSRKVEPESRIITISMSRKYTMGFPCMMGSQNELWATSRQAPRTELSTRCWQTSWPLFLQKKDPRPRLNTSTKTRSRRKLGWPAMICSSSWSWSRQCSTSNSEGRQVKGWSKSQLLWLFNSFNI